jgi:hypothetical protein
VARDAVATRRGFGSPQATSQKREVARPAEKENLLGKKKGKSKAEIAELEAELRKAEKES